MLEIIRAKDMDPKVLDRVTVGRITNTAEQMHYLDKMLEIKDLSLVVIDNVTDLFSFEYSKESSSLEKHIAFMRYMRQLVLVTIKKRVPVVVTNMTRKSESTEKENLDRSISMFTHRKIRLSRFGKKYFAQIFPSFGTKKEVPYVITSRGLEEVS